MRFIVDFYRYAILAALGLIIAVFAFLVLSLGGSDGFSEYSVATIFIVGTGLVGFIGVSLGLIATFISIHDRHVELVEEVRLMRMAIEQRGGE